MLPVLRQRGLEAGVDLLIGLAPRRDWFLAEGFGLRELDRIYSGTDPQSTLATHDVLGLVNDVLHQAPSHREGELVKCVENAYRHMDITLANELTLAFPDVDMVEVLHWPAPSGTSGPTTLVSGPAATASRWPAAT